ncbi:hypothetical protein CDG77_03650 [Nostoc sp. 'Peltigera membranacea cyanobiont' 213]|uniref:hypothetical protein n=1 Tax=unclassified Nostoc TaxID=2593658 RepID=UPI000B95739A|nr:hypothetical protein [Nostoc sp. 'Peltigera membranacea cyanobiont' 213]OYD98947.1 hypothetical protein CDG77_03650 [Nostoc sp. 'Peltigera membranacea cyanobiont' 213]
MVLVLASTKAGIKAINLRRVTLIKYQVSEEFRNQAKDAAPKHHNTFALEIQQKLERRLLVMSSLRATDSRERLGYLFTLWRENPLLCMLPN